MVNSNPITEADLHAYADHRLSADRALEVERHLASNPAIAATVMADMANARVLQDMRDAPLPPPNPLLMSRAQALDEALRDQLPQRRIKVISGLAAGAVMAICVGLFFQASHRSAPAFVDDAVMSRQTAMVRARMASQPEAPSLDRREISAATQIELPVLPANWRLTDVQVFPSDNGPSVGIVFVSPRLGSASLFAVRTPGAAPIDPTTIQRHDGVITYWTKGDMSYALIARAAQVTVSDTARSLANQALHDLRS